MFLVMSAIIELVATTLSFSLVFEFLLALEQANSPTANIKISDKNPNFLKPNFFIL